MESYGAFLDDDMESLSKMFSGEDSDQFLLHFNVGNFFSNHGEVIPSPALLAENMAGIDEGLYFSSDANFNCVSRGSCSSSESGAAAAAALLLNRSSHDNYNFTGVDFPHNAAADFYPVDGKTDSMVVPVFADEIMEEILQLKAEMCNDHLRNAETTAQAKRKHETSDINQVDQDKVFRFQSAHKSEDHSPENPPKKSRVSGENVHNNKRVVQPKRSKKSNRTGSDAHDQENNARVNGQSSSSCCSEDDSNASHEPNGGSVSESKSSKGKARASRGSATDPQSLYARKRRERINERLRILQNLVPNGTKVDISTMLEEAVHYVKFLQLQIKLLSSDDLWMYAPIAYNGMDMGLYQKINSPNLWP